jgi:hypothetical protein
MADPSTELRQGTSLRRLGAALAMLAGLAPGVAGAHQIGLSQGEYAVRPDGLSARLVFARGELGALSSDLDRNGDGALGDGELEAGSATIAAGLLRGLRVRAGGAVCEGQPGRVAIVEGDGVAVEASWRCPAPLAEVLELEADFLGRTSQGHRHVVRAETPSGRIAVVLFEGKARFALATRADAPPPEDGADTSFLAMVQYGVTHILIGWDHLLFLLGLVLVGGRLRTIVGVVSAFTVGHSITLALAALRIWTPSAAVIEPLIALSIVYVGVENFFVESVEGRWYLTGLFGLVHGFGFAGVLAEIQLPSDGVLPALVAFNLGVELGQLVAIAAVLPVLGWLRRRGSLSGPALRVTSGLIATLGAYWFVERVWF